MSNIFGLICKNLVISHVPRLSTIWSIISGSVVRKNDPLTSSDSNMGRMAFTTD